MRPGLETKMIARSTLPAEAVLGVHAQFPATLISNIRRWKTVAFRFQMASMYHESEQYICASNPSEDESNDNEKTMSLKLQL